MCTQINPCTALIVEDDIAQLKFLVELEDIFLSRGLTPQYAESLSESKAKIKENDFDVFLVDLNLSDSKGADTVSEILNLTDAPVFVYTALDHGGFMELSLQKGAAGFYLKGVIPATTIIEILHFAGGEHRAKREIRQIAETYKGLAERAQRKILAFEQMKADQRDGSEGTKLLNSIAEELTQYETQLSRMVAAGH